MGKTDFIKSKIVNGPAGNIMFIFINNTYILEDFWS